MEHEQAILAHLSAGLAILNCSNLHVRYVNPYLQALLKHPWHSRDVTGCLFTEILPEELQHVALLLVQKARETGHNTSCSAIPYEGFLRERGRTYWRISVKQAAASEISFFRPNVSERNSVRDEERVLIVLVEDMTELARSRLYLNAIQSITSAIAGPFALPQVLDRMLQSVHELVGSTRCAVLLIEPSVIEAEQRFPLVEEPLNTPHHVMNMPSSPDVPTITIAAQKGMHLRAQAWRPHVSELLFGRIIQDRHTLVITDTRTEPELKFPLLDDAGIARRPGSVLCVPIFEPTPHAGTGTHPPFSENQSKFSPEGAVIGTIEVYHRKARGFPPEEVDLLEQFAQQAGLAIQNARLFRRMNRLARDASRSARQQKNVMQAIPDGVIIYDPRWRVADANPAIRELFGWTDDVIGLPMDEALAQSSATFDIDMSLMPNLTEMLDQHSLARRVDEIKLRGADGKNYTMRRSYAPIHDELGDIFASVVIYHDVTKQALARERIEAEVVTRTAELAQRNTALQLAQAAQELESTRMELLLERLPSGVVLVSADDHSIMMINRQAAQMVQRIQLQFAIPADIDVLVQHFLSKNMVQIVENLTVYDTSGSIIRRQDNPLLLALVQGEATEAEIYLKEPDGQLLFLLVNAAPLRDSEGNITSVVLVLHEITRIKALERVREDFFTTMAHELKTPLANIRAHLSALQVSDYQWSPEEQQDFIETADEQVERLVKMINQFLDASRVEAGALRLDLEPVLLPELLEDLQERLEALISSSKRTLKLLTSPLLPTVFADYELLISVLTNLLSNAFRYTPEDGLVLLEVKTVYDPWTNSPGIEFRVTDQGPGLSEEQQAELFTRFSTFAAERRPDVDRPGQPVVTRQQKHIPWSAKSGLGLYISRGIIEAHGSKLTVKSHPGSGATFGFVLNVAGSSDEKAQ